MYTNMRTLYLLRGVQFLVRWELLRVSQRRFGPRNNGDLEDSIRVPEEPRLGAWPMSCLDTDKQRLGSVQKAA
jgi:hypothetical protein